jgi:hypothetical protein
VIGVFVIILVGFTAEANRPIAADEHPDRVEKTEQEEKGKSAAEERTVGAWSTIARNCFGMVLLHGVVAKSVAGTLASATED